MGIRHARKAARLTVAVLAVAAAAGATTAHAAERPDQISGYEYGYGATLQAAENDAITSLHQDFYGCLTPVLIADGPQPDGTWWAEIKATCQGAY